MNSKYRECLFPLITDCVVLHRVVWQARVAGRPDAAADCVTVRCSVLVLRGGAATPSGPSAAPVRSAPRPRSVLPGLGLARPAKGPRPRSPQPAACTTESGNTRFYQNNPDFYLTWFPSVQLHISTHNNEII